MRGERAPVQEQDRPLADGAPIEIAQAQAIDGDPALVRQDHVVKAETGAKRSRLQMVAIFLARQAHVLATPSKIGPVRWADAAFSTKPAAPTIFSAGGPPSICAWDPRARDMARRRGTPLSALFASPTTSLGPPTIDDDAHSVDATAR